MRTPTRRGALPRLALAAALAAGAAGIAGTAGCGREPEPVTNPRSISLESPFSYPIELWDEGAEGQTLVMIHVTERGAVDSVYVLESSGRAAFDSAAVQGARNLKFAPGRRGERRIDMWARIPVRFDRSDSTQAGAIQ